MFNAALQLYDDVSPAEGDVKPRATKKREELSLVDGDKKMPPMHRPKLIVSAAILRPARVFRLRGTFVIDSQRLDDGTLFVRHRDLPVYGYGETLAEALDGFNEMFERQWTDLVECDASELEESAVEVREQLRHAVEAVQVRQ